MVPAPTACSRSSSLRPGWRRSRRRPAPSACFSTWNIPGPASTPSSSSLRIVEGSTLFPSCVCRPYQYHFVARALDAGALGIMVPMVETAQQARDIGLVDALSAEGQARGGGGSGPRRLHGREHEGKVRGVERTLLHDAANRDRGGRRQRRGNSRSAGRGFRCASGTPTCRISSGSRATSSTRSISTRYGGLRPRP